MSNSISQRFLPIVESMRYSLGGGGKRLRPLLVLASAESLGIEPDRVLPAAVAIEWIHTYSLIHDDLPAFDDDDVRRGRASSHKRFGEAMAVLTGDALLTESFGLMLKLSELGHFTPTQVLNGISLLVQCSGISGMVGGQWLDVSSEPDLFSLPEVEFVHIHKTGAMILGSVLLPTRLHQADEAKIQARRRYGEALGLAFQISDDLLDSEPNIRYARGPRKKPKPCYTKLMSPSEIKGKLNTLIDSAVTAIANEGEKASALRGIAEYVRTRKK